MLQTFVYDERTGQWELHIYDSSFLCSCTHGICMFRSPVCHVQASRFHGSSTIPEARWAKASSCFLQVSLSCAALCQIVSLQYLSGSSLHRLTGLPCHLFLSYGLQVVTLEVHLSSLMGLIALPGTISFFSHCRIYLTFVLSLTQMLVFLCLYVILNILLPILVCEAASLF